MTKRKTQAGVIDCMEFDASDNLFAAYETTCNEFIAARRLAGRRTGRIHDALVHSGLEIHAALNEYRRLCGATIQAEQEAFDKAAQALFDAFTSAAEEALAKAQASAAMILCEYNAAAGEADKMLPLEDPSELFAPKNKTDVKGRTPADRE